MMSSTVVSYAAPAIVAALLSLNLAAPVHAQSKDAATEPTALATKKRPDFGNESASKDVHYMADWIVHSADNKKAPFAIVDKVQAKLFVFQPDGKLLGAAPVLLGLAKGDDSVPGIGERELSDMPPSVRTTPAGRFVSQIGKNAHGKEVVWVDYDAAVSMHRVINTNPKERRPHRLATPTPADNRISFGCINVPIKFFEDVLYPTFEGTPRGIIYVLPETRPLKKVFTAAYDVEDAPTAVAVKSAADTLAAARHGVTGGQ